MPALEVATKCRTPAAVAQLSIAKPIARRMVPGKGVCSTQRGATGIYGSCGRSGAVHVIRRDEPLEDSNAQHMEDMGVEVDLELQPSERAASEGALVFLRSPSQDNDAEASTSSSSLLGSSGPVRSQSDRAADSAEEKAERGASEGKSSDAQPSPQFLQLMGLWDRLSSQIQHIPGNPSVVANAMKLCVSNSAGSLDVLGRGMSLCTRLAELGGQYSTTAYATDARPKERSISMTTDVIAAAMLSEVFSSLKAFPSSMVRSKVSREVALVAEDVLKVRQLGGRIDVYEDDAVQAARRMCLAFYDVSAIVVEVVRRVIGLEELMLCGYDGATGYRYQADALEAVQLYAPLGHALGLKSLSLTLENAALELLFPTSHKKTSEWLDTYVSLHDAILESARQHLEEAIMSDPEFLSKAERVEVQSRTKSAISTLKKLLRLGNLQEGGRKREEVFDVLGLRVIVVPKGDDSSDASGGGLDREAAEQAAVEACYVVERIVASMWPAIESRSKDYIASPKPNGYSSIHKSVIVADRGVLFDEATTVELQIRTASMHQMAELGNAAHSAYKGGLTVSQTKSLREVQEQKMSELLASAEASVDYDAGEGLFRSIDINGDGHVSLSELRAVLEELGDVGADRLLEKFDLNNDGVISLEEFMEFQKAMGLSSAISLIDERYAQSVPEVVDSNLGASSSSIKPYSGGHGLGKPMKERIGTSSLDDGSSPGTGNVKSSSMHVWGPSSFFSFGEDTALRTRAMAFTDGDEAGSLHGSLDEPRTSLSESQDDSGDVRGSFGSAKGNVVVLDDRSGDSNQSHRSNGANGSNGASRKSLEVPSQSVVDQTWTSDAPPVPPVESSGTPPRNSNTIRRLFSKSGTQEIESTWSIEPVGPVEVANAVGKPFPPGSIDLPRHGPVIVGAVQNRDNDLIIDVPTVSGRHARFEVIRDRANGLSKCVLMDLGSTNGVWVNRAKVTPFKEVSLFPGDVVCFAEPKIAFKIDAHLTSGNEVSSGLGPAVTAGLSVAETLEAEAASAGIFAPSTSASADIVYQKLLKKGEFQSAYMLLLGEAMKFPEDGAIWAKLAGIERQRARRKLQNSTVATTRVFLRAAVERFDAIEDQDIRRTSLARVFSTWAMLEFDMRNDGPARIIFQKGVRCLSKLTESAKDKNELLAKLLCNWATREWKLKDLTVAMRLCTEALEVDPENPFVLTLAGKISAQAGKNRVARKQFQKAITADRRYMPALQAWAKMGAGLNRMETARKVFQAAYIIEPDNQYILQAWAHAEATSPSGDLARARELYAECVKKHPSCRAALHGWAKLEDSYGCFADAKELYERVLALKPTSKRTLSCLGRLERLLGNLDESEALLRRAIASDPQHVASLQELALTLKAKRGQPQLIESKELAKKVGRINSAYRMQISRVRKECE